MNEITLYKYIKRVDYLKVIFIKLALSTFVTFLLKPDFSPVAYPFFIFMFYFICSLYHIGLRLFHNYFLAILSPLAFVMLMFYIGDVNTVSMEQSNLIAISLLLFPFIYDFYIVIYVIFTKIKMRGQPT